MSTIEMTATAKAYREIQAEIKALEEQTDALKQQMVREMDARNVEKLEAGEYTIRWSLYESSHLDSAKLKADHSDSTPNMPRKPYLSAFKLHRKSPIYQQPWKVSDIGASTTHRSGFDNSLSRPLRNVNGGKNGKFNKNSAQCSGRQHFILYTYDPLQFFQYSNIPPPAHSFRRRLKQIWNKIKRVFDRLAANCRGQLFHVPYNEVFTNGSLNVFDHPTNVNTQQLAEGVPITTVAKQLGHSNSYTTMLNIACAVDCTNRVRHYPPHWLVNYSSKGGDAVQISEFLSLLDGVKGSGSQYIAKCPAHDDRRQSLSISTGNDGRILVKCHAGCSVDAIWYWSSERRPQQTQYVDG